MRWRSPAQLLPCGRCWASAKTLNEKGTAVNKKYQKSTSDAPGAHGLTVPEHVTVAMAEIAGNMREGLLALAVGAGSGDDRDDGRRRDRTGWCEGQARQ